MAEKLGTQPSKILALAEDASEELAASGISVLDDFPDISTNQTNDEISPSRAAFIAGAAIAVPLVGPVLGGIVAGLSAYHAWKEKSK